MVVLFVDDEALVGRTLEKFLKRLGYRIRFVSSSAEALEVFTKEGPFDLLLTDVHLPGVNGDKLARQLLQLKPDLKVIFISGDPTPGFGIQPKLEGPSIFRLAKPFDLDDLLHLIDSAAQGVVE